MERKPTIAQAVQARFGMTEEEYFRNRLGQGWSAGRMAEEIGYSTVSVAARLKRFAIPVRAHWAPR